MISLDTLNNNILSCTNCELRRDDEEPIIGKGAMGGLLIVGDYPNYEDSLMGRPFEQRSGQILQRLIQQVGFSNSHVRYTYAVRCRPSKTPKASYIRTCRNWLDQEIYISSPKIILALGLLPATTLGLAKSKTKLSDIVGSFVKTPNHLLTVWYGPNTIMNGGKVLDQQTVEFLKSIKELL